MGDTTQDVLSILLLAPVNPRIYANMYRQSRIILPLEQATRSHRMMLTVIIVHRSESGWVPTDAHQEQMSA